jgi:hypothetical protein
MLRVMFWLWCGWGRTVAPVMDDQGNSTFSSRATVTLLGYEPGELVGRQVGVVIAVEDLPPCPAVRCGITSPGPTRLGRGHRALPAP